jgi:hypothetical protein
LFDALVRFNQFYPQLPPTLQQLATVEETDTDLLNAIATFSRLVENVTQQWERWDELKTPPRARDRDFVIKETHSNNTVTERSNNKVTIEASQPVPLDHFPLLELPEFDMQLREPEPTVNDRLSLRTYDFSERPEGSVIEYFGESDIPDRKLTLPSLDIIAQQNAWAAIWLTRNDDLISGGNTNPAFVFQTPQIRFSDRLTPLLTNSKRWNVATLQAPHQAPINRPLRHHVANWFAAVLPAQSDRTYDIRIACQYAFALVLGDPGLEDDLLSTLPVFLSPRFVVGADGDQKDMAAITAQLQENIAKELQLWQQRKRPVQASGRFVFSLSIFSHVAEQSSAENASQNSEDALASEVPLLKIEHLSLALNDISEYLQPHQNIAALLSTDNTAQTRTLGAHLETLVKVLMQTHGTQLGAIFDPADTVRYHLQTVVNYVFEPSAEPESEAAGASEAIAIKLLSMYPEAIVSNRIPLPQTLEAYTAWGKGLLGQLQTWQSQQPPAETPQGRYVFSLSLLSEQMNLETQQWTPPNVVHVQHFYLDRDHLPTAVVEG